MKNLNEELHYPAIQVSPTQDLKAMEAAIFTTPWLLVALPGSASTIILHKSEAILLLEHETKEVGYANWQAGEVLAVFLR